MLYGSLGLYHNQERILSRRTSSSDMRVSVAHSGDGVEDGLERIKTEDREFHWRDDTEARL